MQFSWFYQLFFPVKKGKLDAFYMFYIISIIKSELDQMKKN